MSGLPRVAFDRESVRVFIPQSGWYVYHIQDADRQDIYVGASKNPRSRLLDHVRAADKYPGAVWFALEIFRSSTAMARRERELTDESGQSAFGRRHAAWKARVSKPKEEVPV